MKNKIELEYIINSPPKVLFSRLSTPSGLAEWFSDDVVVKGNIYTFIWGSNEEKAEMIGKKDNKSIRFKWIECDDNSNYFEFKIEIHELTGELALLITDFVEDTDEEDIIDLWNNQVEDLKHAIGI